MKTILMAFLLLILASCGGGRYHRSVIVDCKVRGLTESQCSDEYYGKKYDENSFRYVRGDNRF